MGEFDRHALDHGPAVGGLDGSADRARERLPMRLAEEFARRPAVEPQALDVDLGDTIILVENEEPLAHRSQHARVAGIARIDGGSGEVRLGDVLPFAENSRHTAGLISHGLVGEVEKRSSTAALGERWRRIGK
jgi:hypothetical protein